MPPVFHVRRQHKKQICSDIRLRMVVHSRVVTVLCSDTNATEAGCHHSAASTAVFIVYLVSEEGLAVKTLLVLHRERAIEHTTLLDK